MRKTFLTVIGTIALAAAVNAQTRLGLEGGANFANLKSTWDDDVETLNQKTGFNAGAFAVIPLSPAVSVRPEVLFSDEGAKRKDEDVTLNLSYLNVPLLIQYNALGLEVHTGPQVGFRLSAKAKFMDQTIDLKDELQATYVSWAFGMGYRLKNGLGLQARYNLGLSNVEKSNGEDRKTTGQVLQVGVSMLFAGLFDGK